MADDTYKTIISEIIQKQIVILGPAIAVMKARSIEGLEVSDDGKVLSIQGDPQEVMQKLIDLYVDLSGQIVKNALGSIFAKYPGIEKKD